MKHAEILSRESSASDNFRELEKRIRNDKKSPGVIITLSKQNMVSNLIVLINQEVIGFENLEGFSDEVKEIVKHFTDRA